MRGLNSARGIILELDRPKVRKRELAKLDANQ